MTQTIIIGNIISFIAAVFLGFSCWSKKPKRVFTYMIIQNAFLCLSSVVFGSYSAAVSTILSSIRCYVIVKEKYTRKVMIIFNIIILLFGIFTNTRGLIGLLPVLATVQFGYCTYRFTGIKGIKWTFIINLVMWDVYAFWIMDFSSGIAWAVTTIITIASLITIVRNEHKEKRHE